MRRFIPATRVYTALSDLLTEVSGNTAKVGKLAEAQTILREWKTRVDEVLITMRLNIGQAPSITDLALVVARSDDKVHFGGFLAPSTPLL